MAKSYVKGFPHTAKAIHTLGQKARVAAVAYLYQTAEVIIGDSKERHVPVDTGTLRDSGFLTRFTRVTSSCAFRWIISFTRRTSDSSN